MAERHPYAPAPGGITSAIVQFRKSFPTTINAETLKQLAIAPKNESYVINVLRFIGAIDKEGKQTEKAVTAFSHHNDADFQKAFEELVKKAYSDLFALHNDAAWGLSSDKLITFFRSTDKTTDLVGRKQAATFQLLAGFAGHGTAPAQVAPNKVSAMSKPGKPRPAKAKTEKPEHPGAKQSAASERQSGNGETRAVGLTVRIEVNLPPAGDQETYDRIFRSIRENLLNAE